MRKPYKILLFFFVTATKPYTVVLKNAGKLTIRPRTL